MELYDVMRTTFSARAFTDDGLSDEVLYRILDNARFAANAVTGRAGRWSWFDPCLSG